MCVLRLPLGNFFLPGAYTRISPASCRRGYFCWWTACLLTGCLCSAPRRAGPPLFFGLPHCDWFWGGHREERCVRHAGCWFWTVLINRGAATGAVWPQVPLAAQVLKTHVGMLRPDFLKRCNPDTSVFRNGFVPEIGSTAVPACRSPPSASLQDGHYSFPSGGHAHLSEFALRYRASCLRRCTESNTATFEGSLRL